MTIREEELVELAAPFKVVSDHDGSEAVIVGFSENDPLGVGGGMFPKMPTVYFESGGWCLLSDFMRHWSLPRD